MAGTVRLTLLVFFPILACYNYAIFADLLAYRLIGTPVLCPMRVFLELS
jgi:hypothetical protein